jgi:hypothetical protein|tara:strand:+ start:7604 stop:8881 length:1278 start_codon:yes stop_codon:yes gene_type:complete
MGYKDQATKYQAASGGKEIAGKLVDIGEVDHVILSDSDDNILTVDSGEENPKLVDTQIGSARIRKVNDFSTNEKQLTFYLPLIADEGVPLVGETVQLVLVGGSEYYKRIPAASINVGNARVNAAKKLSSKTDDSTANSTNYSEVSQTSTATSGTEERDKNLGEYFKSENIHKLRLYEGDKILQSRFGQSIRFSGYNNTDSEFSPTIIIRNRENDESRNDLKKNDITEEELNKDGSTIAMVSDKYKMVFQPGLVDSGGSSNFKTNPINHKLPEEYVGNDQILINSERIILSSKAEEMLFFSKGDYGFISDGTFKIDNGFGGADLDFGDDINITLDRNNSNFYVFANNGNIWLNTDDSGKSGGSGQKEPLARGETLVTLLSELIDAITQQVFATPAGPTAPGPLNVAVFKKIQAQLDKIKSTKNFTE